MDWWQWVLMFVAFLAGGGLVLVGLLAAKVVRGEPLSILPKAPPRPQVFSPKQGKEIWAKMQQEAKERGYGDIPLTEEK